MPITRELKKKSYWCSRVMREREAGWNLLKGMDEDRRRSVLFLHSSITHLFALALPTGATTPCTATSSTCGAPLHGRQASKKSSVLSRATLVSLHDCC